MNLLKIDNRIIKVDHYFNTGGILIYSSTNGINTNNYLLSEDFKDIDCYLYTNDSIYSLTIIGSNLSKNSNDISKNFISFDYKDIKKICENVHLEFQQIHTSIFTPKDFEYANTLNIINKFNL